MIGTDEPHCIIVRRIDNRENLVVIPLGYKTLQGNESDILDRLLERKGLCKELLVSEEADPHFHDIVNIILGLD